jgi:hypothetical protein
MTNLEGVRDTRLRRAIVLGTTEQECTVFMAGQQTVVPYAATFPQPRGQRVAPGHLAAVASAADGSPALVWRWFDAVVLGVADPGVSLWEPAHGTVLAQPRNPLRRYVPGTRAYLSAGLPGADWWVAGPAVTYAEEADVDLGEVDHFLADLGL